MEYKLSYVRVFVTDWDRAVAFYTGTLEMPPLLVTDGWAEFATGEARLALERIDPSEPEGAESVGRFVGVSLAVPEILATYERLSKRGVEFVGAPERQTWGGVLAHLKDPDGNILTLFGRSKDAHADSNDH